MPYERDVFDGIEQAHIDEVAVGLADAITASLATEFEVGAFSLRTVLMANDGLVTVRWAVECVDSSEDKEERRRTYREVTVHGVSLVGDDERGERVVQHYIDWAGVMSQLGMTTSRPSAVDPSR
jgi:hypothetical protein